VVHQDAKVIAEVCPSDTESPHTGENEDIATDEESAGEGFGEGRRDEVGMARLVAESAFISGLWLVLLPVTKSRWGWKYTLHRELYRERRS
jgi:hypothetical protein